MPCCTACGHGHADDFEVLPADTLGSLRCEACRVVFWSVVMNCHRCAHEQAFSWPQKPPDETLPLLTCPRCLSTFLFPPDAEDSFESADDV